jgi:hypothetical protein
MRLPIRFVPFPVINPNGFPVTPIDQGCKAALVLALAPETLPDVFVATVVFRLGSGSGLPPLFLRHHRLLARSLTEFLSPATHFPFTSPTAFLSLHFPRVSRTYKNYKFAAS